MGGCRLRLLCPDICFHKPRTRLFVDAQIIQPLNSRGKDYQATAGCFLQNTMVLPSDWYRSPAVARVYRGPDATDAVVK